MSLRKHAQRDRKRLYETCELKCLLSETRPCDSWKHVHFKETPPSVSATCYVHEVQFIPAVIL